MKKTTILMLALCAGLLSACSEEKDAAPAPESKAPAAQQEAPAAKQEAPAAQAPAMAPFTAMLSTLAYSPCEPYGKRVKWRSLSH